MPYTAACPWFGETLRVAGWKEVAPSAKFQRGDQTIIFDTSNWMELYIEGLARIADLRVPERGRETEGLAAVEHLFAAAKAAAR